MTVTVRTCPVTVSRDVTGVGVHVDVGEDEVISVLLGALVDGVLFDVVSDRDCRNC